MYYMRQYKWFQSSLWRSRTCHELGLIFFLNVLKTCPILDIILSYFKVFVNIVKLFVPYSNYNINEARFLTIIIVYNKTKWKHNMTKTTLRWANKWCVELSLQYHRNIFHVATISFWRGNMNFMIHQEYYVHVARTFYKIFYFVHEVELTCLPFMFMGSHGSYVALSPLFGFWKFLEVWWG
jgi:hypothetical protein